MNVARVAGLADFNAVQIGGDLRLDGAAIAGKLSCTTFDGPPSPEGGEPAWLRPEVTGSVSLSGAEVSGDVDFEGIGIAKNLIMQGTAIKGGLSCKTWRTRTVIGQSAMLMGINVTRDIEFDARRLLNN